MSQDKVSVPVIDIGPLFMADEASWKAVDAAIVSAAKTARAFVVAGMPEAYQVHDRDVAKLHTIFSLPGSVKEAIALRNYKADSPHLWRGYSATLEGGWAHNEIYDIGPETTVTGPAIKGIEILTEANAWPAKEPSPGWRAAMNRQYRRMHQLNALIMRSLARGLGADEEATMSRFSSGFSTLRLLNYPPRPAGVATGGELDATRVHNGEEHPLLTMEHDDSCCLSTLWQDSDGGLQVQTMAGVWLDVPRVPGAVSVHFGDAIEPFTGGLLKATPHRVLGAGGRQSMGFFYEPDLDAELSPLPGLAVTAAGGEIDTYALSLLKVLVQRGMYSDLINLD